MATPSVVHKVPSLPLPSHVVAQFPEQTWVENIAVRPNGALLLTTLSPNASMYQVTDPTTSKASVSLVHTFAEVRGLLGITETTPDVFVVVGTSFTVNTAFTFSVDFNNPEPIVKTVAGIPEAVLPNGLTSLPGSPTTVLIADSGKGLIWRIDTLTGQLDVAIQVPEMNPRAEVPVGINGLHIFGEYLYFTNSALATIFRVKVASITSASLPAAVETVAVLDAVFLDDFAFAADGTLYVETNKDNRLIALKPDCKGGYGEGVVIAGSLANSTIPADTAAAFGRTESDGKILYVTTGGVTANPENGTLAEGGKVVAIDTTGY